MPRCIACGGSADTLTAQVVSIDGDFVCSPACKARLQRDRAQLQRAIEDNKVTEWLGLAPQPIEDHHDH